MKKNKIVLRMIVMVQVLILMFGMCTYAYSGNYNYIAYGYHYSTVTLDLTTYMKGNYYSNAFAGLNGWSNADLGRRDVTMTSGSSNKMKVVYGGTSNFVGLYEPLQYNTSYAPEYFTTKFQILLIDNEIGGDSSMIKRTAAHEIGHALGLDHYGAGIYSSIMQPSVYSFSYYLPQDYDIDAVKAGWPTWN